MAHLTLSGLSADGTRLLLVSDTGDEHTLDVDAKLRAALPGDPPRSWENHMDSALRPRDIQARIRAGEDPESVAQAAKTTLDKIMPFAAPVLAERNHVAQRAQASSVRRRSGESGARTLGDAVALQLRGVGTDPQTVEWDAWRREDGRWTLTGAFAAGPRSGTATFGYDMRGNFVTLEDDDARWLVGESTETATGPARDDLRHARERRLTALPADELPLGEDALEMVSGAPEPGPAEGTSTAGAVAEPEAADPNETTLDLGRGSAVEEDSPADSDDESPAAGAAEGSADEAADPPAPPRRSTRKSRGRASVPSWDEIMFGGGKSE